MINDHKTVRDFLIADTPLTALVDDRIYAAVDTPVKGWKPSIGGCVVFKRRGGPPPPQEHGQLIVNSYQFKCYGGGSNQSAQVQNAEALYRALYDRLQFAQSHEIMSAEIEVGGNVLPEPDLGWPFVLSFFRLRMRKTA